MKRLAVEDFLALVRRFEAQEVVDKLRHQMGFFLRHGASLLLGPTLVDHVAGIITQFIA